MTVENLRNEIADLKAQVTRQAATIRERDDSLRQARGELHVLSTELMDLKEDLASKDVLLVSKDAQIHSLQERNDNQKSELERRAAQLEVLNRVHDEMIEKYPDLRDGAIEIVDAPLDIETGEPIDTRTYARTEYVRIDHMPEVHPVAEWWMRTAREEVEPLIAKMIEYGGNGRSVDLTQIGEALLIAGLNKGKTHRGQPTEGDVQELGVYFYLVGKMARWTAAISEGRPVSDDTLKDIGIYVRMAQRIREAGGWPV